MSIIPRPNGHHVITPASVVADPKPVISFLEEAFAGKVVDRYDGPNGEVFHAEVLVGDSVLMIGSSNEAMSEMPSALSFYVDDSAQVDSTYQRALKAGAKTVSEPETKPWGYRAACVADSGGNRWTICAIVEELTHDQIVKRMQELPQN